MNDRQPIPDEAAAAFARGEAAPSKKAWRPFDFVVGRPWLASLIGLALGISGLFWLDPQFIGQPMSLPLEQRFPACAVDEVRPVAGVVMLAGDFERVKAAVDLGARLPEARLLISSGGEAYRILKYGKEHGVAPERLTLFEGASSTFDEAATASRLADPKPGERWLLVTSAKHLPRAAGVFWKLGFDVTPWPVYATEYPSNRYSAREAVREWFALLFYRIVGRTDKLLPAPRRDPLMSCGLSQDGSKALLGAPLSQT